MPAVKVEPDEARTTPSHKSTSISKPDQDNLDAINSSVDRMRTFIGSGPYALTIPQEIEPRYHHGYQYQAMQWLHNTPFRYSEGEWMQYQTFFYHEHGKDMYLLVNTRLKEEREDVAAAKPATGANTPAGAPRKKISLDAYKKKQTIGTPTVEDKQEKHEKQSSEAPPKPPAAKISVERVKAETEEVLASAAEVAEVPLVESERKSLKRKREEAQSTSQLSAGANDTGTEQSGTKRARRTDTAHFSEEPTETTVQLSQPRDSSNDNQPVKATEDDSAMPPKLSPLDVPALPSRLSPTLPANIVETLQARARYRSASTDIPAPNSGPKNGMLTPMKDGEAVVKKKRSPIPRNGFRANSSSPAVRSDAEGKATAMTSVPPNKAASESSEDETIAVRRPIKKGDKLVKRSLIVTLKYKKSQRDAIRRILNMRPKPLESTLSQSSDPKSIGEVKTDVITNKHSKGRRPANAKGVAQRIGAATNGTSKESQAPRAASEKRPTPSAQGDSESPAKKRKTVPDPIDLRKEPSTPSQADTRSPMFVRSKHNSQQVTPTVPKDAHLAVAMQRNMSSDSHKTGTPSAQSGTPGANSQNLHPNSVSKVPSSHPSHKTPSQQAWEMEQRKLEAVGRELKHAATAHLKSLAVTQLDRGEPSREQSLAAVKSVESLLAYLLAFTSADEAALAADPKQNPSTWTWRSLQAFFAFVRRNCELSPELSGLACLLGVVINARILQLTAQYPAEGPSRDTIIDVNAALQQAAADADAKLDLDVLKDTFPETWEKRSKGALHAEKMTAGEFDGPFKLPLGVQTSPLHAARAGVNMLKEWVQNHGIDYELKLKL